ncbi:MAG: glutamine-hydrolyzing carbamoyl-phosphate synthase small subunit [Christensenellales bacterium]
MACIVLEDGSVYKGTAFGYKGDVIGEIVFNTGMSGYQELLTDPSYHGQIVTMTYPLIGNYGVNTKDAESDSVKVSGFIVHELCAAPSNWLADETLDQYLKWNGVCGISGVDTRALTRKIRERGTMAAMIKQGDFEPEDIEKLRGFYIVKPVDAVTCKEKYRIPAAGKRVAVIDLGLKRSMLKALSRRGCDLTVFPAHTPADEILDGGFDGVLLSNGPGNPKDNDFIIEQVKIFMRRLPVFGICLGFQLMALAQGAGTFKLHYGHRGSNHPVGDIDMKRTFITSQNHGYAVKEDSIPKVCRLTHTNRNDGTVEGIEFSEKCFGVQFHPEASAGPKDTEYLFNKFVSLMDGGGAIAKG